MEQYWEIALAAHPGRIMLVDLADVTPVDSEGRALLARMLRKGVRMLSTGVLSKTMAAEIAT